MEMMKILVIVMIREVLFRFIIMIIILCYLGGNNNDHDQSHYDNNDDNDDDIIHSICGIQEILIIIMHRNHYGQLRFYHLKNEKEWEQ